MRNYLLFILILISSFVRADDEGGVNLFLNSDKKAVRLYRNGEIIQSFKASDFDFIRVEDFIETPSLDNPIIGDSQITISWQPIEGATYSVYRSGNNIDFEILIEGLRESTFTDTAPLPASNYYRVKAFVNGNQSEISQSICANLIPPVELSSCSQRPIDLSIAVMADSVRYFLTPDEYQRADLASAKVEGLVISGQTGDFIISPSLLNSNNVARNDALLYYSSVLPTQEQAITISARIEDINATLDSIAWTPFVCDQPSYFYLTKTPAQDNRNFAMELSDFSGGALTQSSYGHLRGVSMIPDGKPVNWHDELDMTPTLNANDEIEGLRIVIGDQDFTIRLTDAQSGKIVKEAAMALYSDILPTRLQADIIAMRYTDINRRIQELGGDAFQSGNYLTRMSFDADQNFAINFSADSDAEITIATEGFIRGINNHNQLSDSIITIGGGTISSIVYTHRMMIPSERFS